MCYLFTIAVHLKYLPFIELYHEFMNHIDSDIPIKRLQKKTRYYDINIG